MNPILLKQNVDKWLEAHRKLSEYRQQQPDEFSQEEGSFIDILREYDTYHTTVDSDDAEELREMLEEMRRYNNRHPNNKDVVTQCNTLRTVASQFILGGSEKYAAFRKELRERRNSNRNVVRPTRPAPQPTPTPTQAPAPTPQPSSASTSTQAFVSAEIMRNILEELERSVGSSSNSSTTGSTSGSASTSTSRPAPVSTPRPTPASTSRSTQQTTTKKDDDSSSSCFGCLIWIAIIAACYYGYKSCSWFGDSDSNDESYVEYIIAETMNVRSDSVINKSNVVSTANYGATLSVKRYRGGNWKEVYVNGRRLYVSAEGIAELSQYITLNSAWGDEAARNKVKNLRHRRALIDITQQGSVGHGMQLFGETNGGRNIYTDKSGDIFAFILDNPQTGERTAFVYTFSDDGTPRTQLVENVDSKRKYIKSVSRLSNSTGYSITYGTRGRR